MRDRLFYPLAFAAAIALVLLAMNWPEGDALPPGAPPAQPTPEQPVSEQSALAPAAPETPAS